MTSYNRTFEFSHVTSFLQASELPTKTRTPDITQQREHQKAPQNTHMAAAAATLVPHKTYPCVAKIEHTTHEKDRASSRGNETSQRLRSKRAKDASPTLKESESCLLSPSPTLPLSKDVHPVWLLLASLMLPVMCRWSKQVASGPNSSSEVLPSIHSVRRLANPRMVHRR